MSNEIPFQEGVHICETFQIALSRNEALFLDDSFTLMIEKEMEDMRIQPMRPIQTTAGLAVPMELLEKIGKAVVYTTSSKDELKEYAIDFDFSELLMIREVASSYIKVGEEPVGYNLKRKVCEILYKEELEQEENNRLVSNLLKDIDIDMNISSDGTKAETNVNKPES